MNNLTVAYITSRKEPRIEWFFESLARQVVLQRVIVIDRFGRVDWIKEKFVNAFLAPLQVEREKGNSVDDFITVSPPKPNVWSGAHRLTAKDYFSASNYRNTAVCLCKDPEIAFVDDLSVSGPNWWRSVVEAMQGNYIALGAYQKVKKLVVKDGKVESFEHFDGGVDNRIGMTSQDVTPCGGNWCYGCSLAMPLEWLLSIGGWPEFVDGMGFEDVLFGLCLQNNGYPMRYDKRMMTYESEEDHFTEEPMARTDKGISPNDKSHAALKMVMDGLKYFENYYEGGIRALREYVLAGNPFPVCQIPQHDWFDSQPISEF